MLASALFTPRLYLLYTTQCFVIKPMHQCDAGSWTEVILVCPWCGSVTEAETLMLSLPLTVQGRILCDRGWNKMSRASPTNIDWLCGFGCLGRGDRESARPCKSVEWRLVLLVFGMQMRSDSCQAKSAHRWTIKSGLIWNENTTMLHLIPNCEDEHAKLVRQPAVIWQVARQSGLALGLLYLSPSLWQMLQLAIAMAAKCWRGFVSNIHLHPSFSLFAVERISSCWYLIFNRNKSDTDQFSLIPVLHSIRKSASYRQIKDERSPQT